MPNVFFNVKTALAYTDIIDLKTYPNMALLLDSNLEIGARMCSEIGNLIWSRHSF